MNNDLDIIKSRLKLSDLIAKNTKVIRKGSSVKAVCPFHHEKTPSFSIDDQKGLYHCFGCGESGNHFTFVQKTQHMDFKDALKYLADLAGVTLSQPKSSGAQTYNEKKILNTILKATGDFFQQQLTLHQADDAREYLKNRNISNESIEKFLIGYAPKDGGIDFLLKNFDQEKLIELGLLLKNDDGTLKARFRNRIIFPIVDNLEKIVGFGGRALGNTQPKYLNSSESIIFQKRNLLYGLPYAKKAISQSQQPFVVEGYFDVISMHQAGFHATVAPLGTALTHEQLLELWRLSPIVYLMFDGDQAGYNAATKSLEKHLNVLNANQLLRLIRLPTGSDPDTFLQSNGAESMRGLIDNAESAADFLFNKTLKDFNFPINLEDKLLIKNKLRYIVSQIADREVRNDYGTHFNNRLSTLKQSSDKKFPQREPSQRKVLHVHSLKPIKPQQRKNEEILLAILMVHPHLWDKVGEELLGMSFKHQDLEKSRKELVFVFLNTPTEMLEEKLKENNYFNIRITDLAHTNLFLKSGYKNHDLTEIWQNCAETVYHSGVLAYDKNNIITTMKKDLTMNSWEQLKLLKKV